MTDFSEQLARFLPKEAAPVVSDWLNATSCQFRIAKNRKTKLGDYRSPHRGAPHRISVNGDLNPYAFLITTVHEFAHLKTWQQFRDGVRPHGAEWKHNFKQLMLPFLEMDIFPADVLAALRRYIADPAASSCTDMDLYRVLKAHDSPTAPAATIESLAEGTVFTFGERTFRKGKKLRKRYKCIDIASQKVYLFHPVAEIVPAQRG